MVRNYYTRWCLLSTVAILVPVLDRPHRVEPLLASIAEATDDYRVMFAASDQPTIDVLDRVGATYITDAGGDEGSYPKRINRLFNKSNEPYVFLGADDLSFRPGWFQEAARVMDTLPNSSGVVAINDLHNMAGVHFLVSRGYIAEFGGTGDNVPGVVMCEALRHCYVDDECREVARSRGRFAFAKDAVVEHLHVGAGKSPDDSTYRLGGSFMARDRDIYISRGHLWQS
jgi:hypothetical protein